MNANTTQLQRCHSARRPRTKTEIVAEVHEIQLNLSYREAADQKTWTLGLVRLVDGRWDGSVHLQHGTRADMEELAGKLVAFGAAQRIDVAGVELRAQRAETARLESLERQEKFIAVIETWLADPAISAERKAFYSGELKQALERRERLTAPTAAKPALVENVA